MLKRLVLLGATVACVSLTAFGRASYPEYSGEMGISVADSNLDTDVTVFSFQYTARFREVVLDDKFPHELQPWAQRRSSVILGFTSLDYDRPANDSKTTFVVSAVDFNGRDIGLTASYGSGDLDAAAPGLEVPRFASFQRKLPSLVERDEVLSVGAIVNKFPGYMLRFDLDLNSYTDATTTNNWEALSVAAGTHPEGSHMWWEAGVQAVFDNAWGDHVDAYVSGVGYIGPAVGLGFSIASVNTEDSSRGWASLFVRGSTKKMRIDLGAIRDFDDNGSSGFSFDLGYRF
jgi:hypothetical protein